MNNAITAVILTYNEEKHISRCINSLKNICEEIFVIDSFSKDRTIEIAKELGAEVYQHPFINQAQQFNWAIENCPIHSEWIWRVDADEYIEKPLAQKAKKVLEEIPNDVNGIYVNKKIVFQGRPLLHGGWYPAQQIKIIRKGFGASENKWMDEHLIIFSGKTISIDGDQTDENLNDLTWWTDKHNHYASREAINMLMMEYNMEEQDKEVHPKLFGTGAERKRWLKTRYGHKNPVSAGFQLFFQFLSNRRDKTVICRCHRQTGQWFPILPVPADAEHYNDQKQKKSGHDPDEKYVFFFHH